MPLKKVTVVAAIEHLQTVDPVIGGVIDRVGSVTLKLDADRFGVLVRSIVSQQISTKAAQAIRQKLLDKVDAGRVTPEALTRLSDAELRDAGLSGQKASYLKDLSARALDGRLQLGRIGRLDDQAAIEHLIQVKGIGVWTAQMFLIFSLGRLDVFPHDDFGVRAALRNLYGLDDLPKKSKSHEIALAWEPYRTIGAWYCWRSLELKG